MLRKLTFGLLAMIGVTGLAAIGQQWPNFPILNGGGSYCASTVNAVCVLTVPAGPTITGLETVPVDTNAASGASPQSAKVAVSTLYNRYNGLIGGDFGQNLWQRGTTPISAVTANASFMAADGWYGFSSATQYTVSKQTGATDQPPGSQASMRVARVAAQTGTAQVCTGQLLPNDSSDPFIIDANLASKTAVFSVDLLAGANFSATGVNMVIAYHSAADATASANGQGTNTGTFASSVTGTQNITNYVEAVNTLTPITTTWTRYSVAAQIPNLIPTTATATTGVGVKLCFTPVGTAGTNDWFEVGNAQIEHHGGTSTAYSPFVRRTLAEEWLNEVSRFWSFTDPISGTPIFANGMADGTTNQQFAVVLPAQMRIIPTTTPITVGTLAVNIAGTLTSPTTLAAPANGNTKNTGLLTAANAVTSGQATQLVGRTGTGAAAGNVGFSAEP